ncbi:MAG TPA: type 2 lantipeptide synthetase LanM [Epulopiscium sp.]|nr:type 2 lantipeptide synthetase LanM [Candidatus Epulonipiscium sp.]
MKGFINEWISYFDDIETDVELNQFMKKSTGDTLEKYLNKRDRYGLEKDKRDFIIEKYCTENWKGVNDNICVENDWYGLYKPFINDELKCFEEKIKDMNYIEKEKIITLVLEYCVQEMMNISYRAIVLEINELRVSGLLQGKDKFARYDYYIEKKLNNLDYVVEFFRRYPVLFDLLRDKVKKVFNYTLEIFQNVEKDYQILKKSYFINETKMLSYILFNSGDVHNGGKFVCILYFDNIKVIYKPRNMDIDINISILAQNIKETSNNKIQIHVPFTIARKDYGFVEYIEPKECGNNNEIKEFFYSMGSLLGLLYFLGAKDFHGENIISSGKNPFIIDNETVLHKNDFERIYKGYQFISNKIMESVYSIGLLPHSIYSFQNDTYMEIGALNSGEIRKSPYLTQALADIKTDEIHVENIFKEVKQVNSSPKLNGEHISCKDYADEISKGFKMCYKFLYRNKNEFIISVKSLFGDLQTRYIFRNTNNYTQMIETSHHPALLKNNIDREVFFLRLGMNLSLDSRRNRIILMEEIREIKYGDIPLFFVNTKENVISSNNDTNIDKFEDENIIETLVCNISKMSPKDLNQQLKIINMSFIGSGLIDPVTKNKSKVNYGDECLVNRFLEGMITFEHEIGFFSLKGLSGKSHEIVPIGYDLYQGMAGIILALTYEEGIADDIIERMIKYSIFFLEDVGEDRRYGAFDGVVGFLYALANTDNARPNLKINIEKVIYKNLLTYEKEIVNVKENDVIMGKAGILGALLTIREIYKSNFGLANVTDNIMYKLYKLLIDEIIVRKSGLTWTINSDIGYAHGNVGILTQLVRYSLYRGENSEESKKIKNVFAGVINYEKSRIDKKGKYVLRDNVKYYTWCNGAVGILLSKKFFLEKGFIYDGIEEDINLISLDLVTNGLDMDHSICHGNIGNMAVINNMCEKTSYKKLLLEEIYNHIESKEKYDFDDWGLMTGESGLLMARNGLNKIVQVLLLEKTCV